MVRMTAEAQHGGHRPFRTWCQYCGKSWIVCRSCEDAAADAHDAICDAAQVAEREIEEAIDRIYPL